MLRVKDQGSGRRGRGRNTTTLYERMLLEFRGLYDPVKQLDVAKLIKRNNVDMVGLVKTKLRKQTYKNNQECDAQVGACI